jgi:hypothetical protein
VAAGNGVVAEVGVGRWMDTDAGFGPSFGIPITGLYPDPYFNRY